MISALLKHPASLNIIRLRITPAQKFPEAFSLLFWVKVALKIVIIDRNVSLHLQVPGLFSILYGPSPSRAILMKTSRPVVGTRRGPIKQLMVKEATPVNI